MIFRTIIYGILVSTMILHLEAKPVETDQTTVDSVAETVSSTDLPIESERSTESLPKSDETSHLLEEATTNNIVTEFIGKTDEPISDTTDILEKSKETELEEDKSSLWEKITTIDSITESESSSAQPIDSSFKDSQETTESTLDDKETIAPPVQEEAKINPTLNVDPVVQPVESENSKEPIEPVSDGKETSATSVQDVTTINPIINESVSSTVQPIEPVSKDLEQTTVREVVEEKTNPSTEEKKETTVKTETITIPLTTTTQRPASEGGFWSKIKNGWNSVWETVKKPFTK